MRPARVGVLLAVLIATALFSASAASAETVQYPTNPAPSSSINNWLSSISCPAAGDCVSVGDYTDVNGHLQPLIETERNGSWSATALDVSTLPDGGAHPFVNLVSVTCTSVGNCVAAGYYDTVISTASGLVATETNGSWTLSELPFPANPKQEPYFAPIACWSAGNCVDAGAYWSGSLSTGGWHAFTLTEINGAWSFQNSPPPGDGAIQDALGSVSCDQSGHCSAVGWFVDATDQKLLGLIETYANGVWTPQVSQYNLPSVAFNPKLVLGAVGCAPAGGCSAVGRYLDAAGNSQLLTLSEVNGVWQPAVRVQPPSDFAAEQQQDLSFNSISCPSAGNCAAVGSYDSSSTGVPVRALVVDELNGQWGQGQGLTLPAGAANAGQVASLDAVHCTAAGSCVAAGTYVAGDGHNAALVAAESAGQWTSFGSELANQYNPGGTGGSIVDTWASLSCSPDAYCAAVGYAQNGIGGASVPFLLDAPGAVGAPGAFGGIGEGLVTWSAPSDNGGVALSGYRVVANDLTDPARGGESVVAGGSATSAVVTGLTPGDSYTFTVSAIGPLGAGPSSTSGAVVIAQQPGAAGSGSGAGAGASGGAGSATGAGASGGAGSATGAGSGGGVQVTSTASGGPRASGISRAALLASLGGVLVPRGAGRLLARLRHSRVFVLRFRARESGRVVISWYRVVGRGRHARRQLVARGMARAFGPRVVSVRLRLTALGKRLVRLDRALRLTAIVRFSSGRVSVVRSRSFVLR